MRKITLELDHIEFALLAGCIARSLAEINALPNRDLKDFRADLCKLMDKVEHSTLKSFEDTIINQGIE